MGGSKENRHTPGLEHWSIAVKDGKVLEKEWQTEIPIPRGGPHRFFIFSLYAPEYMSIRLFLCTPHSLLSAHYVFGSDYRI